MHKIKISITLALRFIYFWSNITKDIAPTIPWAYPVIVEILFISKFSLKTLDNINHIPRLEIIQAKAPSNMP